MKHRFNFLFVALLMMSMLSLCTTASAQSFKAIYCASNSTLYFVYDTEPYAVGGNFTPNGESTPLNITQVYTTPRTEGSDQWGEYRYN